MQTELKIKEILSGEVNTNIKVKQILKIMNWDEGKLINAIAKYGTSSKEGRNSIINVFWGKPKGLTSSGKPKGFTSSKREKA